MLRSEPMEHLRPARVGALPALPLMMGAVVLYRINFIDHPPEPSRPGLDMDTVDATETTCWWVNADSPVGATPESPGARPPKPTHRA